MQRGYGFSTGRRYADLYAPEKVVQEAIRHTVEKLGARQVKTGRYPVILTDSAARSLIGHFKEAIMGYNIYLRTSFLMDKLGCQVMPAFLQLQEDPHVTGCLGSSSYDGEGVRTYAQDIVKDGRLQEYFLGSYSARKLGLTSNAHAGVSFCQYVRADQEHTKTPEEMMQQAGEGLIIDSLIGQGVDVTSGNYSRGASGFYFKDGVKQFPVENITLAGNLKDMLLNIACVGSDIDERYRLKCGSLLLPDLAVSGE